MIQEYLCMNKHDLVWEFYFGYYEVDDIWSKDLSNNSVQRFRNPLYMNVFTYVTGHTRQYKKYFSTIN